VGDYGAILATTDGGWNWSAQDSRTSAELTGVAFSDATHGWVVGMNSTILATTDGGATWGTQSARNAGWLTATAFSDAAHGWAVGSYGTIIATTDGGGPPVKPRYKVTPPAVPPRVRAGARIESWGTVKPQLKVKDRIVVFWEHYIGGRWDMVLARKPADSQRDYQGFTKYSVRMVFKPGKWRVRATVGAHEPVTSVYRIFSAH
jgi:hypothetical protein